MEGRGTHSTEQTTALSRVEQSWDLPDPHQESSLLATPTRRNNGVTHQAQLAQNRTDLHTGKWGFCRTQHANTTWGTRHGRADEANGPSEPGAGVTGRRGARQGPTKDGVSLCRQAGLQQRNLSSLQPLPPGFKRFSCLSPLRSWDYSAITPANFLYF
ncbi:UPF0764 protein C16orf89 [Plecturocebus cupreus]